MDASIPEGTTVGDRWLITGVLGAGGFGQVLSAEDVSEVGLGSAAVKVLHPNTTPQERQAFLHEVQKIAGLRHQNLVGYLDSGQLRFDGVELPDLGGEIRPYLVTELCDRSLDDHLTAAPGGILLAPETKSVLADVTAGLAHLHDRGLIHRDIKPGNVLWADGHWKLADFGLMRDLSATGSYHRGELLIGTPLFMAPELFTTMMATAPSDIYAVGVLAHLCLAGRALHRGAGPALMHNVATTPPAIDPAIDGGLAELIRRCVDADPGRRPSARELGEWIRTGPPPPTNGFAAAGFPANPTRPAPSVAPPVPVPPAAAHPAVGPSVVGPGSVPPAVASRGLAPSGEAVSGRYPQPPTDDRALPPASSGGLSWKVVASVGVALAVLLGGLSVAALTMAPFGEPEESSAGSTDGAAGDVTTADGPAVGDGAEAGEGVEAGDGAQAGDGVDAGDGAVVGDGVEIGEGVTLGGDDSTLSSVEGSVPDAESHLDSMPCADGIASEVSVTNRHDVPVDYRLTVLHYDAAGVRIGDSLDTVRSLPAGARSLMGLSPSEEGVVSCEVGEFSVTPTAPDIVATRGEAEIVSCILDEFFGDWYDIVYNVGNPDGVSVWATTGFGIVDATGLRLDEAHGGTIFGINPGERVQGDATAVYSILDNIEQEPAECIVTFVELSPDPSS